MYKYFFNSACECRDHYWRSERGCGTTLQCILIIQVVSVYVYLLFKNSKHNYCRYPLYVK